MKLKEKASQISKNITAVFFAQKDKDCPWYARAMCAFTVAYALSPIDLIPDFIPILGYLDDIIILPLLIILCVKLVPKQVMDKAKRHTESMPPKRWYFALPIAVIWLVVITVIIFAIKK